MSVFVSYSFDDKSAYRSLRLNLEGAELDVWDAKEMLPGAALADQLQEAIARCDSCVFVATKRSLESTWCHAELGAFWGTQKPVFIYVADPDVRESEMPPQFKGHLWTDDPSQVIRAISSRDPAGDALPLSGGMVYLLRALGTRGWQLADLTRLWTEFNGTQAGDVEYKAAKYACQCLEALGLAQRYGGDEYGITDRGTRLLQSPSLQTAYKRAFLRDISPE